MQVVYKVQVAKPSTQQLGSASIKVDPAGVCEEKCDKWVFKARAAGTAAG